MELSWLLLAVLVASSLERPASSAVSAVEGLSLRGSEGSALLSEEAGAWPVGGGRSAVPAGTLLSLIVAFQSKEVVVVEFEVMVRRQGGAGGKPDLQPRRGLPASPRAAARRAASAAREAQRTPTSNSPSRILLMGLTMV